MNTLQHMVLVLTVVFAGTALADDLIVYPAANQSAEQQKLLEKVMHTARSEWTWISGNDLANEGK